MEEKEPIHPGNFGVANASTPSSSLDTYEHGLVGSIGWVQSTANTAHRMDGLGWIREQPGQTKGWKPQDHLT